MLDGKEVSEATRLFLRSWQANKEMKKAMKKQQKDMTEILVDLAQKDDQTSNLGVNHHGSEVYPLVTEGSLIFPHSLPLTKTTKSMLIKGNNHASECRDTPGNVVNAV